MLGLWGVRLDLLRRSPGGFNRADLRWRTSSAGSTMFEWRCMPNAHPKILNRSHCSGHLGVEVVVLWGKWAVKDSIECSKVSREPHVGGIRVCKDGTDQSLRSVLQVAERCTTPFLPRLRHFDCGNNTCFVLGVGSEVVKINCRPANHHQAGLLVAYVRS